jgi:nicotinamide mononucleotide transporter
MSLQEAWEQFILQIQITRPLEYVAVFFGIVSVLYSRKENILVYPTGLVNTTLYTYFCFSWWDLYAEASLNFYYTIMSIYGWYTWSARNNSTKTQLKITVSTIPQWLLAIAFFIVCWVVLYLILQQTNSTVPVADSFASATAYTAMLLMTRKKLENWIWWILTNLASIPLFYYKESPLTSLQYVVFLVLAIMGFITWRRKVIHEA